MDMWKRFYLATNAHAPQAAISSGCPAGATRRFMPPELINCASLSRSEDQTEIRAGEKAQKLILPLGAITRLAECPPSALMRQIGWVEQGRISGSSFLADWRSLRDRQAVGAPTWRTIRDYLADATAFAYTRRSARNAAREMLAVNAETVGLLAERAPGEIGFAHAVIEEYLAAEHIHRWAFPDITALVRERSGDPLWRNVISNLVSLLARPTEVESVVAAIETARADEASRERAISRTFCSPT